jgi:hypothetical protein
VFSEGLNIQILAVAGRSCWFWPRRRSWNAASVWQNLGFFREDRHWVWRWTPEYWIEGGRWWLANGFIVSGNCSDKPMAQYHHVKIAWQFPKRHWCTHIFVQTSDALSPEIYGRLSFCGGQQFFKSRTYFWAVSKKTLGRQGTWPYCLILILPNIQNILDHKNEWTEKSPLTNH